MKKLFLLLSVAIATFTNASAANLITDGTFETTTSGNFTLTSGVAVDVARNVWGGANSAVTDNPLATIGVTTGGATGNCAVFTRGATTPDASSIFLYQRLSSPSGISAAKSYKLTLKLKSGTTLSDGYLFIKSRESSKFAVREDFTSGGTNAWCKQIGSIPNTWTEYSQSFVFSNSVSGTVAPTTVPSSPAVPFTEEELNDLIVGFYSTTASGTVYIDDVVLEEVLAAPVGSAATDISTVGFTANWLELPGAVSYKLDVSTSIDFTSIAASYSNLTGTSKAVSFLAQNTNYYYRVSAAFTTGSNTGNSTAITAKTLLSSNAISDGTFSTTAAAVFTFGTTAYVNIAYPRNVWGANNPATTETPIIGVVSGIDGASGNCATFTKSAAGSAFLFQRLSPNQGISSTKIYKLTARVKCNSGNANVFLYIKNRPLGKYAVRENWTTGTTYPGAYVPTITSTAWTTVSSTFVFSKYAAGTSSTSAVTETAFSDAELSDLVLGFYAVQSPQASPINTTYIDDVVLEEVIPAPTASAASDIAINSLTANWVAEGAAAGYQLDVSTNNTFTAILSSYNNLSVSGTSQTVTGLKENTTYYYRVRAVSGTGSITGNSSIITATTLIDPSLVKDGSFISTALGDFTLGTTSYVNSGIARSSWGGVNVNVSDSPLPVVNVTTGGATGNCASFTPGSTQPSPTVAYLYQRLPNPSNIDNTTKTYKLTVKLKADAANVKGFLYIKSRPNAVYAVRADYASGETYAWAKLINGIETSWTEHSQTFVFSNSVTSAIAAAIPTGTAIGTSDLNDLIFGFYSVGGKAYIDDVQLVEYVGTGVNEVKYYDNFIVVNDHRISIKEYSGESVSVYGITGQLVVKTNQPVFNLDRSGLYIVKMGDKTQRVIIK